MQSAIGQLLESRDPARVDEALTFARKAKELEPESPQILDTLGWLYYRKGLYPQAARELEAALAPILGVLSATIGTAIALVIGYLTARKAIAGHRALGFLATAPVAVPGIVLGVGLFLSYARPPFVLYGTLWILLIAFVTIALPAAYQQMQSAFRSVHAEATMVADRLASLLDTHLGFEDDDVVPLFAIHFTGAEYEALEKKAMKMPSPNAIPLNAFQGSTGAIETPSLPPWMKTPIVKAAMMNSSVMRKTPRILAEIGMSK